MKYFKISSLIFFVMLLCYVTKWCFLWEANHCVKIVQMRTRKTPYLDTFHEMNYDAKNKTLRLPVTLQTEHTLRKKCPYSEFFWSAFSRIWTENWDFQSEIPYSVGMCENVDQKNCEYGHFSRNDRNTKHRHILSTSIHTYSSSSDIKSFFVSKQLSYYMYFLHKNRARFWKHFYLQSYTSFNITALVPTILNLKAVNYFCKTLHLTSVTGFWISLCHLQLQHFYRQSLNHY